MKRSRPKTRYTPELTSVVCEYVPPPPATIEQFAREVSADMVNRGHSEFAAKEVSWSLGNFLKLVAELTANQLNRRSERLKSSKESS